MSLPSFGGIHHLKFPVSDLHRSTDFYARALGAERIVAFDHRHPDGALFAVILNVPNLGTHLELRLDPAAAARHAGFNHLILNVDTRASLQAWVDHFDSVGIVHSPILPAMVAWIVVFDDPDGARLRFYTRETHGPDVAPTTDARWL